MNAGRDPRYFFVHVQKAAGTSLLARLKRQFDPRQIYPDDSDERDCAAPTLLVSHLRERYALRRDQIRVVTGHFPLRTMELLGDPFHTITILREPVERTLSSLRNTKQRASGPRAAATLEELYDDPILYHGRIHNQMVKMFSLSPEEMTDGDGLMTHVRDFTPTRLGQAKENLRRVDVLGMYEELEELALMLSDRFGWDLGSAVHANATRPVDVPSEFRARIADDNADDLELYEFGRKLYEQRRREAASNV